MRHARRRLVVAAATIASISLLTAGCADETATESASSTPAPVETPAPEPESDPAPEAKPDDGFPLVDYEVYGRTLTLESRPERIVSLSPSSTEGLFAIGAGPQVVAVDEYSDFPAEAPTTDLSGFTPNVEAIVAYDPDLVVVSYDPGDLVASLEATGVPVLILDAAVDVDGALAQLGVLGTVTGNTDTATDVIRTLEDRIDAAVAAVPQLAETPTYFHLVDTTLFTVTSDTFIGSVYGLFGLENVADPADPDGEAFGYPQLSAEFLVDADPDLVFLAGTDPDTFAGLPGLGGLRAVGDGNVFPLPPDVPSRWGPRIVEFVEAVGAAVTELAGAEADAA